MAQRGVSVGRTEMCAVRSGGRRWWLSCCSHGSRRGPECCCCIRPGSCSGSGSRPGLQCPRAGRSAPAASLACKQTQHRPEMVMQNGGGRMSRRRLCANRATGKPSTHAFPGPECGALEPGRPGVEAWVRCTPVLITEPQFPHT